MALFLRRWRRQHLIEGREPPAWDDGSRDDYCVLHREHPEDYPKQKPDDAA